MLLNFLMRLSTFIGITLLTALLAAVFGALIGATGVCPSIPEVLVYPYLALQFVVPPVAGAYAALVGLGKDDTLNESSPTKRSAESADEASRGAS